MGSAGSLPRGETSHSVSEVLPGCVLSPAGSEQPGGSQHPPRALFQSSGVAVKAVRSQAGARQATSDVAL